jgi:SPP1 gp7 family putative phage head morphogenesis protein
MEADFWRRSKLTSLREADDDGNDNSDDTTAQDYADPGSWITRWRRDLNRYNAAQDDDEFPTTPSPEPETLEVPDESPFTRAQLERFSSALQSLGLNDEEVNVYEKALSDTTKTVAQHGYDIAKELIHVETDFDMLPEWALAQVQGYNKQLGFMVVEREREMLRQSIELALANGDGTRQLAQAIQSIFRDGYHILDADGNLKRTYPTASWTETVARTELSRASNLGSTAFYRTAKIEKIQWLAARAETTCEECSDVDMEVVDFGDDFPFVDVAMPPAHPRCRCVTISYDEENERLLGTQEQRDRATRGGYTAEEYTAKFGHEHAVDLRAKRKAIAQ